jgi:beta-lactamase superfamily II metal-dependent hydrolase
VEISLFGPGYGECAVIHVGGGDWVIVDSCLNKDSLPVALQYLHSLGLNPAQVVKLVVATHWHDDHVRGLGAAFSQCAIAEFVCADALRCDEFLTLARLVKDPSTVTSPGLREFNQILDVLSERKPLSAAVATPIWAVANRHLWRRPRQNDQTPSCNIYSLSPSDASITLARNDITRLIPHEGEAKRHIASPTPNHVAVVLWIVVGHVRILLGSDLENTSDPTMGWSQIVASPTRPEGKATVFKVPHHGSETGHHPEVWAHMLEENPIVVLTPFMRGRSRLPTRADAERICRQSTESYATANTQPRQARNRSNIVNKTIRETVRDLREVPVATGQIRLRTSAVEPSNPNWSVELLGSAISLRQLCG